MADTAPPPPRADPPGATAPDILCGRCGKPAAVVVGYYLGQPICAVCDEQQGWPAQDGAPAPPDAAGAGPTAAELDAALAWVWRQGGGATNDHKCALSWLLEWHERHRALLEVTLAHGAAWWAVEGEARRLRALGRPPTMEEIGALGALMLVSPVHATQQALHAAYAAWVGAGGAQGEEGEEGER